MSSTITNLRYALRRLGKKPSFAAIAIVVLAIGIGANSAVFSIINTLILEPLPYEESGRLYRLFATDVQRDWDDMPLSWLDYVDLREQTQSFEAAAALRSRGFNLTGVDEPVRVSGAEVTAPLFSLLRLQAAQGRTFTEEEERSRQRVAILSDTFWRRQFGATEVVNSSILLDGISYTVIGIMPPAVQLPSRDTAVWVPLELADEERDRRGYTLTVLARLAPEVSQEEAEEELESLAERFASAYPDTNQARGFRLISLHQYIYGETFDVAATLFALTVVFVHLIAVADVASMLMARAVGQEHEFAVRSALGAGRVHLVRLFATESMVLCLAGGALGLLFGFWGTRFLVSLIPADIPRLEEIAVDARVVLFTVGLAVVTGLLFGLVPAVLMKGPSLTSLINEQGRLSRGGRRQKRMRTALVVGEMALACVLLITSVLLIRSFQHLRQRESGFDENNFLTFNLSVPEGATPLTAEAEREYLISLYDQMIEALDVLPGVGGATFATELPGESAGGIRFLVAGQEAPPRGREPVADYLKTGPDFFTILGVSLLEGRPLEATDRYRGQPVVVVNETLARHFLGEDPLFRQLVVGRRTWQVVGVVADFRQGGLEDPIYPTIYFSHRQTEVPKTLAVGVRSEAGDPLRMARSVRDTIASIAPGMPIYNVKTMERILADDIAGTGFMARLLTGFALIALLLAFAGIYGVISYSVSLRLQEVGVRMALGAGGPDILKLIIKEGLILATAGVVVGVFGAFAVTRLLGNWLHGIRALDGVTFLIVAVLLALVGVLAALVPARSATRVDPAKLLHVA